MPRVIGLLLVFALIAVVLASDPIYLPLIKQVDTTGLFSSFTSSAANQTDAIYVSETNQNNEAYTFSVQVGTPAQRLTFSFDLEDSRTVIISKFRQSRSSTYQSLPIMRNMPVGIDRFTLGSITANHTFSQLNNSNINVSVNGLIGLGLSRYSQTAPPSFIDDLLSQGVISQGIFSIYRDPVPNSDTSVIILGGVDDSLHAGHIHYRPLMSNRVWATRLVSITLDGNRIHYCPNPCRAIFSTARPNIYGPAVYVRKINNALNISATCDNYFQLPRLVFHLGPHYLSIPRSSYVYMNNGTCRSRLIPESSFFKQNWILGNLFLRSYYTIFDLDNRRIGWAPLKPTIISSKK